MSVQKRGCNSGHFVGLVLDDEINAADGHVPAQQGTVSLLVVEDKAAGRVRAVGRRRARSFIIEGGMMALQRLDGHKCAVLEVL